MTKLPAKLLVPLCAVAASLALAACGDDEGSGESAGKSGGSIRVSHVAFPEALDPAHSYSVDSWEAYNGVYPGLLGFSRESGQAGAEVVPVLARAMPKVSEDGKTYDFELRDGLKFSDGKPVRASDFKHSIERNIKEATDGSSFYTSIVGAEEYGETKSGGIEGIKVDDASGTISIELGDPRGTFLYELAIPFAGVVPKGTPSSNQTKNPPPGAGRYMFEDVRVGRSYALVKNPNFSDSLKGTPADSGKADRIEASVNTASNAVTKVARGQVDFMVDNPPGDRIGEVKSRYPDRFHLFPTNSSYYFFLNAEVPPFDDLKVRQAANHAVNPDAINRIQGGVLKPAHTILPPGVPGYEESKDLYPFDLEKAKRLVKEAGVQGTPVTVYGNSASPTKETVEYWADTLNQIGLEAKTKIVSPEVYGDVIGNRAEKPQTGWGDWSQDYPHPASFIDTLLNPNNVAPENNYNLSYNAADEELGKKIDEVNTEPELTDEVKSRWADLDREIQQKGYWAVYGNREQSTFFSERMDFENCKGEHVVWSHDWSQFCLK